MTTPRVVHTATLQADGRVLVAGGQNETGATSSAELYDSATGLWTATGSMNTPRVAHIARLIITGGLSGKVLVAGGDSGTGILDTAELYDPSTGLWSYTGSMTLERYFETPSPTTLPDGSIVIVGGTTCCPYHWFNEAEIYNLVNQVWTPTSAKTTPANGRMVSLPDDRVLVAGGVKGTQPTNVFVADAELFDPATGSWAATGSMSADRTGHTLTLLPSGQVLVAGGVSGGWAFCRDDLTSAELFDSSAGAWLSTGDMTVSRHDHTATLLPNGQVLVAGGQDCAGNVRSSAELYTPPPVASVSTASLTFGLQLVGTSSAAQTATLTNTGNTTLTISSIAASGDFVAQDNCGGSLPAGESCTIRITFNPTDRGIRTGDVTVTDDAANSPQVIALAGTGTVVQLTPSTLSFGNQRVGTISRPKTVILTNTGSTPLSIRAISVGGTNFGDFVETTTCGSSVPANTSCEIDVRFAPSDTGTRRASMKVRHDGGGDQPVSLRGTGISN